ncbi:hypothetical protein OPKNFCMD_6617 [Methylobacterium crusticola]|uniref:Uncharacterized protein n=1 Tax=Methylobacterium crusticola TaxID=1697972 RepID=A0ABQ4R839_9HYPH|nr:hypothetical protein OPKNFCMD_6617 [Methylobacterium crusticola]
MADVSLAEVELEHEEQASEVPDWAGPGVSGDPRFRQSALLRLPAQAGRPLTLPMILAADIPGP